MNRRLFLGVLVVASVVLMLTGCGTDRRPADSELVSAEQRETDPCWQGYLGDIGIDSRIYVVRGEDVALLEAKSQEIQVMTETEPNQRNSKARSLLCIILSWSRKCDDELLSTRLLKLEHEVAALVEQTGGINGFSSIELVERVNEMMQELWNLSVIAAAGWPDEEKNAAAKTQYETLMTRIGEGWRIAFWQEIEWIEERLADLQHYSQVAAHQDESKASVRSCNDVHLLKDDWAQEVSALLESKLHEKLQEGYQMDLVVPEETLVLRLWSSRTLKEAFAAFELVLGECATELSSLLDEKRLAVLINSGVNDDPAYLILDQGALEERNSGITQYTARDWQVVDAMSQLATAIEEAAPIGTTEAIPRCYIPGIGIFFLVIASGTGSEQGLSNCIETAEFLAASLESASALLGAVLGEDEIVVFETAHAYPIHVFYTMDRDNLANQDEWRVYMSRAW